MRNKMTKLNSYELNKINGYLNYLAFGIEDNGLSKEQIDDVMNLSCRCFDCMEEDDE